MDLQRTVEAYEKRVKSPLTGIRAFCVSCMGGQVSEVSDCPSVKCPLYNFRMGHNPYHGLHIQKEKIVSPSVEKCRDHGTQSPNQSAQQTASTRD